METAHTSLPQDSATLAATENFLAGVQQLTPTQWTGVMGRSEALGKGLDRDDLVRGAVVAITVRKILPGAHFAVLYGPFSEVIPVATLFTAAPLD